MKTRTEKLLKIMNILAWIVFVGLMIQAGAVAISFFVSISNPDAAKNLYQGLDLFAYRQQNFLHYSLLVGYTVFMYVVEAYIAFQMTRLLSGLNISKPFTMEVVILMQSISYSIVIVWIIAMIYNIHAGILEKIYGLSAKLISGNFLFLAGIVYVFAQMFRRGVELQTENELTV